MNYKKMKKLPIIEWNIKSNPRDGTYGEIPDEYKNVPDGLYQRKSNTIKNQIKRLKEIKPPLLASYVHCYKVEKISVVFAIGDSIVLKYKLFDIFKIIRLKLTLLFNKNKIIDLDK